MTASRMTTPSTRAARATGGYAGMTLTTFSGALIPRCSRTGGGGATTTGAGGASGTPTILLPTLPGIPLTTLPPDGSNDGDHVSGTIDAGATTGAACGDTVGISGVAVTGRGAGGGGGSSMSISRAGS